MPPRKRTAPAAETAPTTTERARAAVARRTAAEPAPPAEDSSVDVTTESPNIGTIDFYGRTIQVQRPTKEQIVVWNLYAKRLEMLASPDMDQKVALKLLTQGMQLIEKIVVDEDDQDWLEGQLADGVIDLAAAFDVVSKTVDVFSNMSRTPQAGPSVQSRARRR